MSEAQGPGIRNGGQRRLDSRYFSALMREGGGYNEKPVSKASVHLAGPCQFAVGGDGVDGQRDRPVVPSFRLAEWR
jgi:hypothetical protein